MNDAELLRNFAENRSESAFRTLVERHLPLVLGTARRLTGNHALAEEVAQTVFLLLAGKAQGLRKEIILSGWLFRTTRFVAARALVAEQRRQRREHEAAAMQLHAEPDPLWQHITPILDDSLARLRDSDRQAVLLRFFERRSFCEIGAALGLSEEAAKKRVTRALDKLRDIVRRRGGEVTVASLAAGLESEASCATVPVLAEQICAAVFVKTAAGAGAVSGGALLADVLAAWKLAKIKAVCVGAAGVAAVGLLLTMPQSGTESKPTTERTAIPPNTTNPASPDSASAPSGPAARSGTVEVGGQLIPLRSLEITVLDAANGDPILGAKLSHPLLGSMNPGQSFRPLLTGIDGKALVSIPEWWPDLDWWTDFSFQVDADRYASRTINWMCSTGNVLRVVTNDYTLKLEQGITLAGKVVDDWGSPVRARVGAIGNNRRLVTRSANDPPQFRLEDYASYYSDPEAQGSAAIYTDFNGRFRIPHFPSDVRGLEIHLLSNDGARWKVRTPLGNWLSAEELPEISYEELRDGTARITFPLGVTVRGVVVDSADKPISEATVIERAESVLRVQSRSRTDAHGRFVLENRKPREVVFVASAEGHASKAVVAQVRAAMDEVQIQLPPELPLRGRVVNEAAQPLAGVRVNVSGLDQELHVFEWRGTTDSEGRFMWSGAPTNMLSCFVDDLTSGHRTVRLSASSEEHMIVLRSGPVEQVRVTGKVLDADSGEPVEHFRVKFSDRATSGIPEDTLRQIEGRRGEFAMTLSTHEIPVGQFPMWILTIEAEGYESVYSQFYSFSEGDQDLEFKLERGGAVEGLILTPDGSPAAGAELAIASGSETVLSHKPGQLSNWKGNNKQQADGSGRFKITKPPYSKALVAFHESGWAILPLTKGMGKTEVRLLPWGRVEGEVVRGGVPVAGERVGVKKLMWDWSHALSPNYNVASDADGRFVLEKVPAGEFSVSLWKNSWQGFGSNVIVPGLQTPVLVQAGQTSRVTLTSAGRPVVAKLHAASGVSLPPWTNALAVLSRDAAVPPEPHRSNYISNQSQMEARRRYANDPAVLAVAREQRDLVTTVTPEGLAVFEQVPPGRYVLEVKLFKPKDARVRHTTFELQNMAARVRATVVVPEDAAADDSSAPFLLGDFPLEPL